MCSWCQICWLWWLVHRTMGWKPICPEDLHKAQITVYVSFSLAVQMWCSQAAKTLF